jgi:hypothetical protein
MKYIMYIRINVYRVCTKEYTKALLEYLVLCEKVEIDYECRIQQIAEKTKEGIVMKCILLEQRLKDTINPPSY